MKICFLLSFTPNPRMNKRMKALAEKNKIHLIYWKRSEEYLWGISCGGFSQKEIDIPADIGNPLRRIFPTFRFAAQAIKEMKDIKPDCIYVQNPDMLAVAVCYQKWADQAVSVVYEVADFHELLIQPQKRVLKKLLQIILRMVERQLCSRTDLLVVTSQRFYYAYYRKFIDPDRYLYMPNAPERYVFRNYQKRKHDHFTVGFIGAVRFAGQIRRLVAAGKQCGVHVQISGSFLDPALRDYCIDHGAFCTGTYDYETEIVKLYEQLDCVFSVYPSEDKNVDLALPNKLYEAIVCGLPIIAAKGTYLSEIVEKYQIGRSIDCNDIKQYYSVLVKLRDDREYYDSLVQNCQKIRGKCFIDPYNQKLAARVLQL